MRRAMSAASTVIILAGMVSQPAEAANNPAKSGAACTQANKTVVTGGQTLVCTKYGRSFVWRVKPKQETTQPIILSSGSNQATTSSSGALPAQPMPTTTPVPAPSATPSVSFTQLNLKIAFVVGAASDPFFQGMKTGASAEAQRLGVGLIWQGDPSVYSPVTQIPIVDSVLALRPNGLVIAPTDPVALQAEADKVVAAGIPVVSVDSAINNLSQLTSYITNDNVGSGALAADALANAIHYVPGNSYQVAVSLTSNTATYQQLRLNGFQSALSAKYPGITIVDTGYSQSQPAIANSNVSNWLAKYPNLSGVLAIDGTTAGACAAVLQAKGLAGKIALIGYDAYPAMVSLMHAGVVSALIAQDPAQEGKMAVDDLVAAVTNSSIFGTHNLKEVVPSHVLTSASSSSELARYTYPSFAS